MINSPKISIIIPVYNSEKYLCECLDSIIKQTLNDFEIICVDDGSTDNSLQILRSYEAKDSRFIILTQTNQFAGVARNNGIKVANGEYLCFLDADDFFESTLLEDVYTQIKKDNADICLYNARKYNDKTEEFLPLTGLLNMQFIPSKIPYSHRDAGKYFFSITSSSPWNKLFRREFVLLHQLEFQNLRSANDVLFVNLALLLASKITVLDKVLVNYRVGIMENLQATKNKEPLSFYKAFISLKKCIEEIGGLFPTVKQSFINMVLSNCLYNLRTMNTEEAYRSVYEKLHYEGFRELGIEGHTRDYFLSQNDYEKYLDISKYTYNEYILTKRIEELQIKKAHLMQKKEDLQKEIDIPKTVNPENDSSSFLYRSYQIGKVITFVPRKIRRLLRKLYNKI